MNCLMLRNEATGIDNHNLIGFTDCYVCCRMERKSTVVKISG